MKVSTAYKKLSSTVMARLAEQQEKKERSASKTLQEEAIKAHLKSFEPDIKKYKKIENTIDSLRNELTEIRSMLRSNSIDLNNPGNMAWGEEYKFAPKQSSDFVELVSRLELQIYRCETVEEIDQILNSAFGKKFTSDVVMIRPEAKLLTNK